MSYLINLWPAYSTVVFPTPVKGLSRKSICQPALHMSQRIIFSSSKGLWHTWHCVSSEGGLAGKEMRDGTDPGEAEGWCSKFGKVRLEWVDELCACSGGTTSRLNPCYVVFAEEFRGAGPKENCSLLEWGVWGPGARSYLRRARVRLRMAGWERGEEWGQCKRVWGSLPTIWMRRPEFLSFFLGFRRPNLITGLRRG